MLLLDSLPFLVYAHSIMMSLIPADNQPIESRTLHDSVWLTDFITPGNPNVRLKYQELTEGIVSAEERLIALWRYVANLPYQRTIRSKLVVNGRSAFESDTWFYPAETIQVEISNCANKSFLLASLAKNELTLEGDVYCVLGDLRVDSIGAHAWTVVNLDGRQYILESTQPNLEKVFIPAEAVEEIYESQVVFDEDRVYTVSREFNPASVLNAVFGVCAIPFLYNYLCERCLELTA